MKDKVEVLYSKNKILDFKKKDFFVGNDTLNCLLDENYNVIAYIRDYEEVPNGIILDCANITHGNFNYVIMAVDDSSKVMINHEVVFIRKNDNMYIMGIRQLYPRSNFNL